MSCPVAVRAQPAGRCRLCGSPRLEAWKTGRVQERLEPRDLRITDARYGLTLPLARCAACGWRFAPGDEVGHLDALYAELEDEGYEESQESRLLQMRWLVRIAREAHPGARSALDVGAASGLLVAEARRQGLDAVGVEPSASLVEVARRQHGLELIHGVLPHPELAGRRFDLVFVVDVIEHVADPLDLLRRAAERMDDRGALLLVTPDVASLAARLLGWRWWHYRLAHVGYFERSTLELAFEKCGLVARRWRRARWFFPVGYLAERMQAYVPVGGLNRLARRSAWLRRLYGLVIPLNLFDSYAVVLQRAGSP
jgi:2-polyprenyl-3-methyl-5-hydroxy-6-metoxy-1,4-benzoquinol methylase